MKFFTVNELVSALIVDSEGLIYGRVEGLRFTYEGAHIVAYVEARARDLVVDVDALIAALKSRRVNVPAEWTLEYLVERAREEGIDIPKVEIEKPVKLIKGEFKVEEVEWVDSATLENPRGGEEKLVVVLLKTPREARYRGVGGHEAVSVQSEEHVKGKLVLSQSRGILGYAGEIVVGPGEVGIRVYKRRGRETINWLVFTSRVRKMGYGDLYYKLVSFKDPYKNPRIPVSEAERVEALLAELKAPQEVFKALREAVQKESKGVYEDVPWSKIRKIREVIITE